MIVIEKRGPDNLVQVDCMVCLGEGWKPDGDDAYRPDALAVCPNCFGAGKVWTAQFDGSQDA